jgi:hypothetical protein
LRASWRLPVAGNPTRTRARCPLRRQPTDRLAILATRSNRIFARACGASSLCFRPVPGYFPVRSIFPGFPGRKYPVISPAMRGLCVSKYLIQKRYLRQVWRFLGPIRFFRGNFAVEPRIYSPATEQKGAPAGAPFW